MERDQHDTLRFQSCCSLDGHVHRVGLARRNNRTVPILGPDWSSFEPETQEEADNQYMNELRKELSINLNRIERRTWQQIIDGSSILEIARAERRSRTAIYARIRGSDGLGGMVAKNPYVALWWCLRLKQQQQNT